MRREADLHADEDKNKRDEIEVRNEADSSVYRSDKLFRDNQNKLSPGDRAQIEAAAQKVKVALTGLDIPAIKSASQNLNQVWEAASAALYRSSAAKAPGAPGTDRPRGENQSPPPEAEVVDAELVEEPSAR